MKHCLWKSPSCLKGERAEKSMAKVFEIEGLVLEEELAMWLMTTLNMRYIPRAWSTSLRFFRLVAGPKCHLESGGVHIVVMVEVKER
jgi:hypothetical protein